MPPAVRIGLSVVIAVGLLGGLLYLVAPSALGIPPKVTWEFQIWKFGWRDHEIYVYPTQTECNVVRSKKLDEDPDYLNTQCHGAEHW